MPATRKDLKDDEILRFLRFSVTESAAGVYTEQSFDTQLSIDRGLIWLIHFVETFVNPTQLDDAAAGASEYIMAQICREAQANSLLMSDPDLIYQRQHVIARTAAIGTDAGPMWWHFEAIRQDYYNPPLVYAAREIHVGVQSSNAAVQTVYGRLGYTLRRVSDKFFYRVAQALIS